jgi:hypothetical protein
MTKTNHIDRRALLKGAAFATAAAAAALASLPAAAVATPAAPALTTAIDPLVALGRRWRTALREWERAIIARDSAEEVAMEGGYQGLHHEMMDPTQADKARVRRRRLAAGLKPYDDKERTAQAEWAAAALAIVTTPATTGAGIAVKYTLFKKQREAGEWKHEGRLLDGIVADAKRLASA